MRKLWETSVLEDGSRLKDHWDHPKYPFRVFKSHDVPEMMDVRGRPELGSPVGLLLSLKAYAFRVALGNRPSRVREFAA